MQHLKLRNTFLSLSTALLLSITGCSSGGSDSSSTNNVSKSLSGIGIDGILMQADVCIDADESGVCEANEKATGVKTDNDGKFTFPAGSASGPLILSGGTDKSTGEAFKGVLKAPAGSEVVTPLTSAIQAIMDNNSSVSAEDAQATIKTAMGLNDVNVSLTSFDPYNGIDGADSASAQKILAKQTQLQILVHTAAATIAGADSGTNVDDAMGNVFDAIVKSFDTGLEVELDENVVAIATRQAAAVTYENDNKLIVAIGDAVDSGVMSNAVTAANAAESVIANGDASNAIATLDGAINDVAKDGGSAQTAATAASNSFTALTQTSDELAATVEERKIADEAAIQDAKDEGTAELEKQEEQKALEASDTLTDEQALELINLYKGFANDAAQEASGNAVAIELIKDAGYNVDANLTTAQDANTSANSIASTLNDYVDTNTTFAEQEKDAVLAQAKIAEDAFNDAQYTRSVVISEANVLQGKKDRIEKIYETVRVLENNVSLELADTNTSRFDTNSSEVSKARNEILSIAQDYAAVRTIANDLNNTSAKISVELYAQSAYLTAIKTELALIDNERTNYNEAAAISAKEKALNSYTLFNTQNALLRKSIEDLKEETLSQLIAARKIKEDADLKEQSDVQAAILISKNAAQLSLDAAMKAAQDANASAVAASQSATAAGIIAASNSNATTFAQTVLGNASSASSYAFDANEAYALAATMMQDVFVTNADSITQTAAATTATEIESLKSSAVSAAEEAAVSQRLSAEALVSAQNAEVPTVDASKQFTLPLTWTNTKISNYGDGDVLKVRLTEVDSSGAVTETQELYSLSSGELLVDDSTPNLEYELVNGAWSTVDTTEQAQVTLSSDAIVAHYSIVNADIRIVSVRDLSSETTFPLTDAINIPITFTPGAKATQYEYRMITNRYKLDEPTSDASLEDFIANHSKTHRFSGQEDAGISFEEPFVGTLVEGSTGNLSRVDNDQVVGLAGTWEYTKLGSSDILAIVLTITDTTYSYSDSENNFFTMFDNSAYRGYSDKASVEYQEFDDGESLNAIAYNDVKTALITYFEELNNFSLEEFITGNTLYYINMYGKADYYIFDENGTFTEIYQNGISQGITYTVYDENITFSDEVSYRHMGKSDDKQGEVFYRFDHDDGYALGYVTLYESESYRDEVLAKVDLTNLIREDVYIKSDDGQLLANFEFRTDEYEGNITRGVRSDTGLWNGTWSIEGGVATILASDGTVTTLEFFETPYISTDIPLRVLINNDLEATYRMRSSDMPVIFDEVDELPFIQSDGVTGSLDFAHKEEMNANGDWQDVEIIFDERSSTLSLYYQSGVIKEIIIVEEADFTALPLKVTTADGTVSNLTIELTLATQSWVGKGIPGHYTHEIYQNNDIYGANIVLTDTQEIVRRRFEYDSNGELVSDTSTKYGYTLNTDGKMVLDFGDDSRIYTLVHHDDVYDDNKGYLVAFVIVEDDVGKDGVIDSSKVVTWSSLKPTDFPAEIDYTPALKVTDINVGDQILLRGKSSGNVLYRFTFTINSENKYTFYDEKGDNDYRGTNGSNEPINYFLFQILAQGDQRSFQMLFKENQYISYDGSEVIFVDDYYTDVPLEIHCIVEIVKK